VLNKFYRVAFRKKVYRSSDKLQTDLDGGSVKAMRCAPQQGRWRFAKTGDADIP
jgi:hypothetical protein